MSAEQAEAFIARLESDEDFATELAALREDPAAVHARIAEAGFDASPDEIRDALLEHYGSELSEDQLAAIAGGLSNNEALGVGISLGAGAVVVAAAVTAAAL